MTIEGTLDRLRTFNLVSEILFHFQLPGSDLFLSGSLSGLRVLPGLKLEERKIPAIRGMALLVVLQAEFDVRLIQIGGFKVAQDVRERCLLHE